MTKITVQFEQNSTLERWLNEAPELVFSAMRDGLYGAAVRGAGQLSDDAPRWTGNLGDGIKAIKTANGAEIFPTAEYAEWVHDGRAPGSWPNIDNLTDWALAHGKTEADVFPIARHIKENGIAARPWFEDYVESNEFIQLVERTVLREVEHALA